MFYKIKFNVLLGALFFSMLCCDLLAKDSSEVAATIAGEKVYFQALEQGSQKEMYDAKLKLYELQLGKLKEILVSKMIKRDPRSIDLTDDLFLATYVIKPISVSPQQIQQFALQQKISEAKLDDSLKTRIKDFIITQNYSTQVDEWFEQQSKKHQVLINLEKPKEPVYQVSIENAAVWGSADAKVTIVEFSDFECPFCAKGNVILKQLQEKYGDQIRIVYKHFPLSFHPNAQKAAEAGLCALAQDNSYFWKLHDRMFDNQRNLSVGLIKDHAKSVGLDTVKFSDCLMQGKFAAQVKADMDEGTKLGVNSTPVFFVNGEMLVGAQPIENFIEKIERVIINF